MLKHKTHHKQRAADYLAHESAPAFLTAAVTVIMTVIVTVAMPSMTMSVSVMVYMRICRIIGM